MHILRGSLGASVGVNEKSPRFIIVGAGASGIATAAKLLENGYDGIVILEAQDRIGGRVHSIPFGKGYVDLGAQWCEGDGNNVVYEMVKKDFEFGDNAIRNENSHCYVSDGTLVDSTECSKLMTLSESIMYDYENLKKSNKSLGEFFDENYHKALQDKEYTDVDKELTEQIKDLSERGMNSLYASGSWYEVSAKMIGEAPVVGYQQLTWKEKGYKTVFDYLMKKLPDPSKALPVDDKVQFNKEVTNIDWSSSEVVVTCSDGSEYRAEHVIVTVSLGFLKKHHKTLFTPQLPPKKVNAIENSGFGTLGKIFLEFEEPFWPTDINDWAAYILLWKKEDKDKIVGTEKEWLREITSFIKEDAQPNIIGAFPAGRNIRQFEEVSDDQLIDGCMWLLEKFLGKTLPRPINMRRSHWLTNKYFLGSYSYGSMDSQTQNVVWGEDLGEALYDSNHKPTLFISGEATDKLSSGYVHGAVNSGWRISIGLLVEGAAKKPPKVIIIGAGASGIAAAAKLLEKNYTDIVILEAQDRIGGRIHSIPFGKGYVDMGAQWCQGEEGNVVYQLVKDKFEFGDDSVRYNNYECYTSDGNIADFNTCDKLMNLTELIYSDYEGFINFNKSVGEFVELNYRKGLEDDEFKGVDKDMVEQVLYFTETDSITFYGSKSWFDVSAKLNAVLGE
ncbi:Peroxisomal N(1)-acetyl-spermine/spermidine oxidase, partial [Pseudolycoriella hygida]